MRVCVLATVCVLCLAFPLLAQERGRAPRAERGVASGDGPRRERPVRRYGAARPGVHLRVLRDYTLPAGDVTSEAIVVIGGEARIDGEARDDVTVVGGTLRIGPSGVVGGRVTAVGAETVIAPNARVRGPVDRVSMAWPSLAIGLPAAPDWTAVGVTLTGVRLLLSLMAALALAVLAPGWIRTIAERPVGVSGLIGLATEVAFVPVTAIVTGALVVSIVGIPLLGVMPFLLLLGVVVWTAGFAGLAARIGGLRAEDDDSRLTPAGRLLRGYAVIVSVTVAGHLLALGPAWLDSTAGLVRATGLIVEYSAWTVGLGAGLASLFVSRRVPSLPPPGAPA